MEKINLPFKFIFFIFIFISFIVFFKPQISYADIPSEPGNESGPTPVPCQAGSGQNYCSGSDESIHINCHTPNTVTPCYLSQDKQCEQASGTCQTVSQTQTKVTVPNPYNPTETNIELGDTVTVDVMGTGTCSQNINLDPGPGLHNIDSFQDPNCKLISSICTDHNPPDQSYKCNWQYSCIAYQLSHVNTDNNLLEPYSTTFTSTNNPGCTSSTSYIIDKSASCNPDTTQDVVDPNGDTSHDLVAKTLDDDKTLAQTFNMSSLPDNYTQPTYDLIKAPLPGIGVQTGFSIIKSVQDLVCNNTIINLIGIRIPYLFCKIDENFGNNETKFTEGLMQNVADTSLPSNLKTEPAQNSCYLQDILLKQGGTETTEGNKIFNGMSASAGSTEGYYVNNSPDNVQGYTPDPSNYNVSIQKTVVSGDSRASDINCDEKKWVDLNYPPGYTPPYVNPASMGCLAMNTNTTPTPTPPPSGGITACDAKWFLYGNPLGNFGDPQCNFNKDALYTLLTSNDTLNNANEFFFVIVPAETSAYPFDPDTYRSHDLIPHTPDPAGAWGMFQMGIGNKPSPYNIDQGNVPWQQQALNAINYNHLDNDRFSYWRTSDFYK